MKEKINYIFAKKTLYKIYIINKNINSKIRYNNIIKLFRMYKGKFNYNIIDNKSL